jgi:hypothetical protein
MGENGVARSITSRWSICGYRPRSRCNRVRTPDRVESPGSGSAGRRAVSLAALIAVKPGQRPRLIYRVHAGSRLGGDTRTGFTAADHARLLDAVHQQLGGPVVPVWGNPNTRVSRAPSDLLPARDWLTVFQLPPYASELSPAGGI